MKKEELILLLNEGTSVEEVATLEKLDEVSELIERAELDSETIKKLKQGIAHLKKETIEHAKYFSEMIKSAVNSEKNEY